MCSACLLIALYICVKFYENITNSIRVMERTQVHGKYGYIQCSKGNNIITKTCLYNFDPLKPHFYIVKLGFAGVCMIFLFLLKNTDCGYLLEPPYRGGSNEYPQSMF